MKLNNFAYSYSKPLRNHTLKIMKIIPGNLLKNLEKSWKYHGILSARKSGNPDAGSESDARKIRLYLKAGVHINDAEICGHSALEELIKKKKKREDTY